MLRLRQFSILSAKHKNDKLDGYYLLREQDRALQLMFRYEEDNELDSNVIVAYMDRKHEIILDILRLLKELGLPYDELEKYVEKHGIGKFQKLVVKETKAKR